MLGRAAVRAFPVRSEQCLSGPSITEAERKRAADPSAGWIASQRDGDWVVLRIDVAPIKVTATATKPPPVAPRDDPHSASDRAVWFSGGGGLS
jgi:hypothetical protein